MTKEESERESGTHSNNDLSRVQKIMKDNNLPTFHSEEDDDETEADAED